MHLLHRLVLAGLALAVPFIASADRAASANAAAADTFASFVNDYYDALFACDPMQAT